MTIEDTHKDIACLISERISPSEVRMDFAVQSAGP